MLEALAAVGALAALAVSARLPARAYVAPSIFAACGLSLTVSLRGLLGDGRTSGWLSLVESGALIGLVFLALRRAPARLRVPCAALAGATAVVIIPAHDTASDSVLANAAGMAVWAFGALVAAGAARYVEQLDVRRARSVAEARRDQRLALARDLHDFVAHDVSAIVVRAQAAQVVGARVVVARTGSTVIVRVTNDGASAEPEDSRGALSDERGGGFGLIGLPERVEALGGTLQAGPDAQGGWSLDARLPLSERAGSSTRA